MHNKQWIRKVKKLLIKYAKYSKKEAYDYARSLSALYYKEGYTPSEALNEELSYATGYGKPLLL